MPWDSDGPLRITIHRSCDTAPFRVVIPIIAITLLIAPDLGYQANGSQSLRLVLVDKSDEFRKTLRKFLKPLGIAWWTNLNPTRFLKDRERKSSSSTIEMCETKDQSMQRNVCENNILWKFCTEKLHLIRISSEHCMALESIMIWVSYIDSPNY